MSGRMIVGLLAGAGLYLLRWASRWQRFSSRERYKSDLRAQAMHRRFAHALDPRKDQP